MAAENGETPKSATVYARGLDERVKIPALIEALREIFAEFGEIIDIVAKKSVKRKGQAFIIFEDEDTADLAIETLQGFELFGKPMQLEFARAKSDAIVQREGGEEALEQHKKKRLAEKERKQALEVAKAVPAKRAPAPEALTERPAKTTKAAPAANTVVPDEYLPPNKILFLRELPEGYGKDALAAVYRRYPGFKEVRLVPGRNNIAFVEYESEEGAIQAKEQTAGMTLQDKAIRVTYQRK